MIYVGPQVVGASSASLDLEDEAGGSRLISSPHSETTNCCRGYWRCDAVVNCVVE